MSDHHEHEMPASIFEDAPTLWGDMFRMSPDNVPGQTQPVFEMLCLFCKAWMPVNISPYDAPAVTLNPHHTEQLFYSADVKFTAAHECPAAEAVLGDTYREHLEHCHPEDGSHG